MILFPKDENLKIGQTVNARVDRAQTWILYGTIV